MKKMVSHMAKFTIFTHALVDDRSLAPIYDAIGHRFVPDHPAADRLGVNVGWLRSQIAMGHSSGCDRK
jgi:hypothetical protein